MILAERSINLPVVLLLLAVLVVVAVIVGVVLLIRSRSALAIALAVMGMSGIALLGLVLLVGLFKVRQTRGPEYQVRKQIEFGTADFVHGDGHGGEVIVEKRPTSEVIVENAPTEDAADSATSAEPIVETPAPAWTMATPRKEDGIYHTVVSAGPNARLQDCQRELDVELVRAAKDYIENFVPHGSRRFADVSPVQLREHVVAEQHVEKRRYSFGPMHYVYLRLEFDDAAHQYLADVSRQGVVRSRLWFAGYIAAALVLVVATVFAYLRIDQATVGQKSGRLKLAAAGVVLVVLFAGVLLTRALA